MSVESAKQRLRELLRNQDQVTTDDLERDIVLRGESNDDLRLAAYELEDAGEVVVLRETHDSPSPFDFTALQRLG